MAKARLTFEHRVLLLALLTGLPGSAIALIFLWTGPYSSRWQWTATVLLVLFWWTAAFTLRHKIRFPLQTISNLLEGIREGDFSIRVRGGTHADAMGEVILEVNALAATLREQRLGALEATALLRTVMTEIDVAIFTFDQEQVLRLVNRAGERLLARPAEQLLGRRASELGLADCLESEPHRTLARSFPGGMGRWGMRRSSFRQGGLPHQLVVLTDLSRALRDEERQAWQRLLRVLGHELNNSLAPIKSLAGSLAKLLARAPRPEDWETDMRDGLSVISTRAEALNRFMEAYSRLARLPQPRKQPLEVGAWVHRVAGLEARLKVTVEPGPPATIQADGDQLDQLLINLVRNAVDAVLEARSPRPAPPWPATLEATDGSVKVGWEKRTGELEVWVKDAGPGLANTANLFVPFFTTKSAGSGIGLALCRQIAEAHGGTITLENRTDAKGCLARLVLPLNGMSKH
jgi:two-component system nitrogen regulation sensor histidine kinase NtrY